MNMENIHQVLSSFERALVAVDRVAAEKILAEYGPGFDPVNFVDTVIVQTLDNIGNAWAKGDVSLSQVYMSGKICESLVNSIMPSGGMKRIEHPPMAIAVLEDMHMLGKRIVYSVLKSKGYDIIDYSSMKTGELVGRVIRDGIRILLLSVLMLPSALHIKEVRKRLDNAGHEVKIIVGGAPFNFDAELWRETGADAMGRSASQAVEIINRLYERPQ